LPKPAIEAGFGVEAGLKGNLLDAERFGWVSEALGDFCLRLFFEEIVMQAHRTPVGEVKLLG
jgi:hypothetical protein